MVTIATSLLNAALHAAMGTSAQSFSNVGKHARRIKNAYKLAAVV